MGDFVSVTGPLLLRSAGEELGSARVAIRREDIIAVAGQVGRLEDVELRLRERYVDLLAHSDVRRCS